MSLPFSKALKQLLTYLKFIRENRKKKIIYIYILRNPNRDIELMTLTTTCWEATQPNF